MKKTILKYLVSLFIIIPGMLLILCGWWIIITSVPSFIGRIIKELLTNGWSSISFDDILTIYGGWVTAAATIYSICILILGYALIKLGSKLWNNLVKNT